MTVWAIVPVKPLKRAKTRLAAVLSPELRFRFAEMMLRQVLAVLDSVPQVAGTLVISRDTQALAIAREMGARTIQESAQSDLNPALTRATEIVRVWGAGAVLLLPADLPFVNKHDVSNLLRLGQHEPCVVIAPDRLRDGTNAMLIRPPGLIEYQYGIGSFDRHIAAARSAGATVSAYESESILLDIDVPDDLEQYNRLVGEGEFKLLTRVLPDIVPRAE